MNMVFFFILGGMGLLLGLVSIFQNERTFFKIAFMLRHYGYRMSFGTDTVFTRISYKKGEGIIKEKVRPVVMEHSKIIWTVVSVYNGDDLSHSEDFTDQDEKSLRRKLLEFEKSEKMDLASASSLLERLPYMNDRLRDDVLSI